MGKVYNEIIDELINRPSSNLFVLAKVTKSDWLITIKIPGIDSKKTKPDMIIKFLYWVL